MTSYKDAFNEAAYEAYEAARERGIPEQQANDIASTAGEAALADWTEAQQDAADSLRKARKEQGE